MSVLWKCAYCNKKFERGASAAFCSIECADLAMYTKPYERMHDMYTECLSCGRRLASIRPRKFCGVRCKRDYRAKFSKRKTIAAYRNPKRIQLKKDVVLSVMRASGYTCVYCGGTAEAIDHVYPLCMGDTNDKSNLVASCETCNSIANGTGFRSIIEKQQYIMARRIR